MDYAKILSISGKSGLFKLIAASKSGGVVESLIDGKRSPTFATDKISSVEDISIFTHDDNIPLKEVFKAISEKEGGKKIADLKISESDMKAYFTAVVPNWDTEKVYTSDIKKVLSWYNLLVEKEMLQFGEEDTASLSEDDTKEKKPVMEKTPTKNQPSKKSEPKISSSSKPQSKQTLVKKSTTQNKAK